MVSPARPSACWLDSIGPRPISSGSRELTPVEMMRASGSIPSWSASARDITTVAAAPSLSGQEFPAVTRPSLRNTGLSVASFSRVVSALGPSSSVMVIPEGSGTGMISRANIPSFPARTARM